MTKLSARVKVVSIGNSESGKSCLIKRYCEKRFVSKYLPTVGVDFGVTLVPVQNWQLRVNFFDLSGHVAFKEVRNEFYKDTQAVMLVYDVTEQNCVEELENWMNEIRCHIVNPNDINNIIFVVFANKVDKMIHPVDKVNEGRLWAEKHGCYYFQTSAQSGDGVNKAFETMFTGIVEVIVNGVRPASTGNTLGYTKEQAEAINKLRSSNDNYSCFGLQPGCTKDDVNKAYRKFARLIHPDKCVAPHTEDAFKILTNSRDMLLKTAK